jgi:hypothetical protein
MTVAGKTSAGGRVWAAVAVVALLATFAVLAVSAAADKSLTSDEPLHLVGGYVHRYEHDFRINPEDPPLFGLVATLAPGPEMRLDTSDPNYAQALTDIQKQWDFVGRTLFKDGNDAIELTERARMVFVGAGVLLGALIALTAWMLAGPWAAVTATAFFALDPNFLAHSAIIKNDVLLSLALLAVAIAIWRAGVRASGYWLAALAIGCGLAVNVKFSGLITGPIVAVALGGRALMSESWTVLGVALRSRIARLSAVAAIGMAIAVVVWSITWAAYGFRFAATSDGEELNMPEWIHMTQLDQWVLASGHGPVEEAVLEGKQLLLPIDAAKSLNFPARAAVWLRDKRLVPQACAFGFLYTYASTLVRHSFLMGKISITGFRWYFPLAMLFKTPLATLAAVGAAAILVGARAVRRWILGRPDRPIVQGGAWAILALAVTPVLYMAAALNTNLDIGLRHVLPVYPFLFIGVGVAAAAAIKWKRSIGLAVVGLLVLGLAGETIARYPNYLAFFNAAAGGPRGGLHLLSDSNLDWGQDLPALAAWQHAHPGVPLYVSYFGSANPVYYGVHAAKPGGTAPGPVIYPRPGVVALSASIIQGNYIGRGFVERLGLHGPPFEVLNGTIYLYNVP